MDKKILIIEDDPATTRLVDYSLRHHGYQVITATNGLEGLRKARSESPDMVILDVMLPGLDGFEVCHRLHDDAETSNIPVIMLSAKGQDSDKTSALSVGAREFFAKPVDRLVLLNKIKELYFH